MSEPIEARGHCYCGAVTYTVAIPAGAKPIFTAYCHCDSCRRAHASPLYHVACVEDSMFQITSGADAIVEFHKSDSAPLRAFCGRCGSKVYNRFPGWRPGGRVPVAFFPDTLDEAAQRALPAPLRASRNANAEECVLDLERLGELMAR